MQTFYLENSHNKLLNYFTQRNVLEMIFGVLALSISPLAVKMVVFPPTISAFYRSFYASVFLFIWAGFRFRKESGQFNLHWYAPIIIGGISLGIDLILWHKTILFLGAGPATFLGNSQVIFVALFAAFVFKEKIAPSFIFYLLVIFTGLYLLMPSSVLEVTKPVGYLYGIIVGITYSIMLIGLRYAKKNRGGDYPELFSLAMLFLSSAITIAVYALFFEHKTLIFPNWESHLLMAGTAFIAQTLGWSIIKTNITKIPAHKGSLILIFQPIFATLWGNIFFSETVTLIQLAGIIAASGGIIFFLQKK